MVGNHHVDAAAGQLGVNLVANARLQFNELSREINGHIALATVDRVEFRGELESLLGGIPMPISGHRSHCLPSISMTWSTSLSPRPLMFTTTNFRLPNRRACFIT